MKTLEQNKIWEKVPERVKQEILNKAKMTRLGENSHIKCVVDKLSK